VQHFARPKLANLRRLRVSLACTILPAKGGGLDARWLGLAHDRSGHGFDNC
jgi:hypothetical protein